MVATAVPWEGWGKEAFLRAKKEDKPILLSISGKWCHWCHVMDSTTYSDPGVAEIIREKFVPIRVDNDQRPDINRRYNMGGWPTTAILTPEGDVITGRTYVPPGDMKALLEEVHRVYKERKAEIYSRLSAARSRLEERKPHKGSLDPSIVDEGMLFAIEGFDSTYGGFGKEPKFPQAAMLSFCLKQHHLSQKTILRKIVTRTLDAMGSGGMYDHVEGGFFRYSTTRDWGVPHFEKMLEDNALLARLYLEAYHALNEEEYLDKALDVLGYLSKNLLDSKGGFYGSQDADEEYYSLGREGRRNRDAPFIDRTVFTGWSGLASSSYLYAYALTGDKHHLRTALGTLDRLLAEAVHKSGRLLHHLGSGSSITGILEDHTYLAQALVDAYQVTGAKEPFDTALGLVDYMLGELWSEAGGFYDKPSSEEDLGLLSQRQKPLLTNSDAASLLLDLWLLTGEESYRERAAQTLRFFASSYPDYGFVGGSYFLAVSKYFAEPLHLTIIGSAEDERTKVLLRESLRFYHPLKLLQLLDPAADRGLMEKKGLAPPDSPTLFPCVGTRCLLPITDPSKIPAIKL